MTPVAAPHVQTERDTPTGWEFVVRLPDSRGGGSSHVLRIAWVDYELWAGGRLRPSDVAEAVFRFAAQRIDPADQRLLDFDASMLRRWIPGADEEIVRLLSAGVEED